MDNIPVIFIHSGNSSYLKYTIRTAVKFNPDKRIILLGDKSNEYLKREGIEVFYFADFQNSDSIRQLDKHYKFIAGADFIRNSLGKEWVYFNFLKWFILKNFASVMSIHRIWTFDSDTLLLARLSEFEKLYQDFDYTTHNPHKVMQGLINNIDTMEQYGNKIIDIFQRKEHLNELKKDFQDKPKHAFTMMWAFNVFHKENKPVTKRLNSIIGNATFDECLFFDDGFKMTNIGGRKIKQIFYDKNGNLYLYHLKTNKYIRLNSINMSWMPLYMYDRITKLTNKKKAPFEQSKKKLYKINYKETITNKINKICYKKHKSLKSKLRSIIPRIKKRITLI